MGDKQQEYITQITVRKDYFFTDKMLEELGPPDLERPNPYYRSAPKMKLYSIHRVEKWVSDHEEWVEKSRIRRLKLSKIQKKIHEQKRNEIIELAKSWQPQLFIDEISVNVVENAKEYYEYRYFDFELLTIPGLISYIRHIYTDYDDFLAQIPNFRGQTGVGYLYPILRKKVDILIEKYLAENMIGKKLIKLVMK